VGRGLASGTVSFLFTDVKGSTTLLNELGADVDQRIELQLRSRSRLTGTPAR
jgi:hypothetical protein